MFNPLYFVIYNPLLISVYIRNIVRQSGTIIKILWLIDSLVDIVMEDRKPGFNVIDTPAFLAIINTLFLSIK